MLSLTRRTTRAATLTALAASLSTSLLSVGSSPAQAATYSAPLRTAISQLPVASEVRTGYDRDLFPHWRDSNGDCQDARAETLISESSVTATFTTSSRCTVATGR